MFNKATTITDQDVKKIVRLCNQLEVDFEVEEMDLRISQFDTGFISSIFRVQFQSSIIRPVSIPPVIVIKFYSTVPSFDIIDTQLTSIVAGQADLGPAVLLVRPDALVMECLEDATTPWTATEDQNPVLVKELASALARFHSLRPPIQRNVHQVKVDRVLVQIYDQVLEDSLYRGSLRDVLVANSLKSILAGSLRAEMEFVRERILRVEDAKNQIVFAHRDFTHSNLLLEKTSGRVVLIDFDYSLWFYRGADIGRYLIDCRQLDQFNDCDLIPDSEMCQFIDCYRAERARILGPEFLQNEKNSTESILAEAKLFGLFGYLIDIIFCVLMASNTEEMVKKKEFLIKADRRFCGLLKTKARFIADGSLDC